MEGNHSKKIIKKKKKGAKKLDANESFDEYDDVDEDLMYVRRRAVIDQLLLKNNKADFSYATNKYKWGGEEGSFEGKELGEWFRVYNQTGLTKIKVLNQ